jgi:hypothetical protein
VRTLGKRVKGNLSGVQIPYPPRQKQYFHAIAVIGFGNTNREIKMKIKSLFVAVLLMAGVVVAPAQAAEKPTVESFTVTPQDIDLSGSSTTVTFELVVSHPFGIDETSTVVTLKNSRNDTLSAYLTRTDANVGTQKVTFKGSIPIPRNINTGVYTFSASGVKNNSLAGYQYDTGIIEGGKIRTLVGAESGLLVRSGGELNLDYETFVGPSYDTTLSVSYNNPAKFNFSNAPIWKVGETYDPTKYYESRVSSLALSLFSSTPSVCSTDGKFLNLIKEGNCSFIVSTAKTKDYVAKSSNQLVVITAARIKPTLSINKISNQDVKDLGKSIDIGWVYSATDGWLTPLSPTPTVCFASGFFVKLISGGTCKLTYQTSANPSYLASDLYTVSFEILKDGQPVVVPTPVATPTPIPKPVVKKTISCVKGTKTIKKTAISPKCPAGYKLKK